MEDVQAEQERPVANQKDVEELNGFYVDPYEQEPQAIFSLDELVELNADLDVLVAKKAARGKEVFAVQEKTSEYKIENEVLQKFIEHNSVASICRSDYQYCVPAEVRDKFFGLKDVISMLMTFEPILFARAFDVDLPHFTAEWLYDIMKSNGIENDAKKPVKVTEYEIERDTFDKLPHEFDPGHIYQNRKHDHVPKSGPYTIKVIEYSVPVILVLADNKTTQSQYFVNLVLHPVDDNLFCLRTFYFSIPAGQIK